MCGGLQVLEDLVEGGELVGGQRLPVALFQHRDEEPVHRAEVVQHAGLAHPAGGGDLLQRWSLAAGDQKTPRGFGSWSRTI